KALYEAIAHQMPVRPRVLNPEVPFGLEKVTMKLLQKKPEQRYQSGDQLALELEALFATGEDWSRLFRTPRKQGRPAAASLDLPSAIVRAGPRAIMVRGPLALTRLPIPEARAPARPRRRHSVALLVAAAASLFLGRHDAQADDEAWLATCSPEARKTVRDLGLEPDGGDAFLEVEVRPGPVQAAVSIAASPRDVEGDLSGEIIAAPEGAS